MKTNITLVALFLSVICQGLFAQAPRVYNVENSGAGCAPPALPFFNQLPVIAPLPDPFIRADGSGRSTSLSDWECRRNEIKYQIENYEIGTKPIRPDSIAASYTAGVLTVTVTRNGQTLTLTCQVSLPAGSGPFAAVIGMNSLSGSVPATVFTGRNIARIQYNHNNVTTYGNPQTTDPYYRLYPDQNLANAGQYSAWAWGVSRIIDGLELVKTSLPIDLQHIGVTGCSYAGKMALFAGAFDERVALTIAQESGGGGAPAWRVSETLGAVEKLGATDYNWFRDSMRQFSGSNVSRLPHDHHELMAMVAPRALLVTGNTDFEWLANPASYVSARAAHEVYKTFGIGDRFGFYIDGGHNHCAVPATQIPAMQAFVDKFLVGDTSVNTNITVNPYPQVDYQRWYQWWGSGNPVLPAEPIGKRIWMEAECAKVGPKWSVLKDTAASGGTYVVVNGLNSTATAPSGDSAAIVFQFTIDSAATYNFVARLNCPTADDDSYWIKIDNGSFATVNGLGTSGWQWLNLTNANLSIGAHTLTVAYREDGAKFDKLLISSSGASITGLGDAATNCTNAPLPLSLVSYQAVLRQTGEVILHWSTAAEVNNKQYRLERSRDGNTYTTISIIAGKGTFNGRTEYSYTDLTPLKGINYYRLIQEDVDGRETSLGVKAVNVTSNKTAIQVYPNPAHSEVNIDLGNYENTRKQVKLFTLSGKLVYNSMQDVKNGLIKVNLGRFHGAGVYMLKIGDMDQVSVVLQ